MNPKRTRRGGGGGRGEVMVAGIGREGIGKREKEAVGREGGEKGKEEE